MVLVGRDNRRSDRTSDRRGRWGVSCKKKRFNENWMRGEYVGNVHELDFSPETRVTQAKFVN